MEICEGVHQIFLPSIRSYVQRAYTRCSVHNSCPSLDKVIVEQQWAKQVLDLLQIIENIRRIVDSAMSHSDVFTHPVFAGIMEGIQSEYNTMQKEPIPRRRTRSHSPQE